MKLQVKPLTTTLGKISLALVALAIVTWLFLSNAERCLDRDFVLPPYSPAVCYKITNDYESTIRASQLILLILIVLTVICCTAFISLKMIRLNKSTMAKHIKTTLLLTALSIFLFAFIVIVFTADALTTFNNNNYALNTTVRWTFIAGIPLLLASTTAAVTYRLTRKKL